MIGHEAAIAQVARDSAEYKRTTLADADFVFTAVIYAAKGIVAVDVDHPAPFVQVKVGKEMSRTRTKHGCECSFDKEVTKFGFNLTMADFLDQLLEIELFHNGPLHKTLISKCIIDMHTIWSQPEHRFIHRWAALLDTNRPMEGPKAYVCCDLVIKHRLDKQYTEIDVDLPVDDDVDSNILLPADQVAGLESQPAHYVVNVYSAETLPRTGGGGLSKFLKKRQQVSTISPYVRVSFVGSSERTTASNDELYPQWNESLTFTAMFPSLTRKLKFVVCDDEDDDELGQAVLDLAQCSDMGEQGYIPTFGPAYLHVYGDKHLNKKERDKTDGLFYRGRLLVSLSIKLDDESMEDETIGLVTRTACEETLDTVNEFGPSCPYLLFATIFSVNLLDESLAGQDVSLELSIGQQGFDKTIHKFSKLKEKLRKRTRNSSGSSAKTSGGEDSDVVSNPVRTDTVDADSISITSTGTSGGTLSRKMSFRSRAGSSTDMSLRSQQLSPLSSLGWRIRSRTDPLKPENELAPERNALNLCKLDKDIYYSLPLGRSKPCLSVHFSWFDWTQRLKARNVLLRCRCQLKKLIDRTYREIEKDRQASAIHVFTEGMGRLQQYIRKMMDMASLITASTTDTALDTERRKQRRRFLTQMHDSALNLMVSTTQLNFGKYLNNAQALLNNLENLINEPQHSIPDVFIWLIAGKHRVAYTRMHAGDVIWSSKVNERGKRASQALTFEMQIPSRGGHKSKKMSGMQPITMKPQLRACISLMKTDDIEMDDSSNLPSYLSSLPEGYQCQPAVSQRTSATPPPTAVVYKVETLYELRAYVYQARGLQPTVDLCNSFLRVLYMGKSAETEVCAQTLDPIWDQTLVITGIRTVATAEELRKSIPELHLEVFEYNEDDDLAISLGTAAATPIVRISLDEECTEDRNLSWVPLSVQGELTGEVLVAFELWQLRSCQPSSANNTAQRAPKQIREVLMPKSHVSLSNGLPALPKLETVKKLSTTTSASSDEQSLEQESIAKLSTATLARVRRLPETIRPKTRPYFLYVMFWGLRDLQLPMGAQPKRPYVEVDALSALAASPIIKRLQIYQSEKSETCSWLNTVYYSISTLPIDTHYRPPLCIRCWDVKNYGRKLMVGRHVLHDLDIFLLPDNVNGRENSVSIDIEDEAAEDAAGETVSYISDQADHTDTTLRYRGPKRSASSIDLEVGTGSFDDYSECATQLLTEKTESVSQDWWTKYYAAIDVIVQEHHALYLRDRHTPVQPQQDQSLSSSLRRWLSQSANALKRLTRNGTQRILKVTEGQNETGTDVEQQAGEPETTVMTQPDALVLYPNELELQPEFSSFGDVLQSFDLSRGKRTFGSLLAKKSAYAGVFKVGGNLMLSRSALSRDQLEQLLMRAGQGNKHTDVVVRVYIVRARNLPALDFGGASDPYVKLKLGPNKLEDKEHRANRSLNPVFGRSYDLTARLSTGASTLRVQLFDYNRLGSDEFMGETRIDIEQRLYTKHRAACGLPGYNAWYDSAQPVDELAALCDHHQLPAPRYGRSSVMIGRHRFRVPNANDGSALWRQQAALYALNHWADMPDVGYKLVPEHVETRTLYDRKYPTESRGELELFVHIFPTDNVPPPIDIHPREPKSFELRVTVWQTTGVPLSDINRLTGTASVDQYVKLFIFDPKSDAQKSDVHYRSLNGDGSFNWRFVFDLEYLEAEQMLVHRGHNVWYSITDSELRKPPIVTLQVWDADIFTKDALLGTVQLNLTALQAAARSADQCTLEPSKFRCNLFQAQHVRGWWSLRTPESTGDWAAPAGKIELEMELLPKTEADEEPVGRGREQPRPLSAPIRPESAVLWLAPPLQFFRYSVWRNIRGTCFIAVIVILLLWFVIVLVYQVPESIVRRIIEG